MMKTEAVSRKNNGRFATTLPHLHIEPSNGWVSLKLHELWEYRELLYFLTWRDIKVRYKQTVLGAAWAIIQPFFTMVVFSLFFGRLAKMPSDGIPYPVFAYVGLLPWAFFSRALTAAPSSLVANPNLIRKVYFPRYLIPTATILAMTGWRTTQATTRFPGRDRNMGFEPSALPRPGSHTLIEPGTSWRFWPSRLSLTWLSYRHC